MEEAGSPFVGEPCIEGLVNFSTEIDVSRNKRDTYEVDSNSEEGLKGYYLVFLVRWLGSNVSSVLKSQHTKWFKQR